jgi:hypothetical protein
LRMFQPCFVAIEFQRKLLRRVHPW